MLFVLTAVAAVAEATSILLPSACKCCHILRSSVLAELPCVVVLLLLC